MDEIVDDPCNICYDRLQHPLTLPCRHYFCYLCVKGVATNQRATCPICRAPFPVRLISAPTICEDFTESSCDDAEVWFYEGRNGWWQYDERTNRAIEEAYTKGDSSLQVLIAGHIYMIDFAEAVQYQAGGNLRRRKIKRDKVAAMGQQRKGTAGVPTNELDLGLLRRNSLRSGKMESGKRYYTHFHLGDI